MQVDISLETLDAASMMVYRRWTEAFDALKKIKAETYDGTPDWQEFHKIRLENHTRDEAKWRKAKDEMVHVLYQANLAV